MDVETANRIVGRIGEHQRPLTTSQDLARYLDVRLNVPSNQRSRCCHTQDLPDGARQQIRLGAEVALLSCVVEQRHSARHGGGRRLRASDEKQTGQTARLTQGNASLSTPSEQRVLIRRLVRLWHFGGEVFEDFSGFREDIRRDDRRAKRSARKGRETFSVRKDTTKCGIVCVVRNG
jgi:hypothetical protein